jgi:hypothetical protein
VGWQKSKVDERIVLLIFKKIDGCVEFPLDTPESAKYLGSQSTALSPLIGNWNRQLACTENLAGHNNISGN